MRKPAVTDQDLIDPIRERWSPRAFDPQREIPPETLAEILDAARWAPSCFNEQPWRFLLYGRQDAHRETVAAALSEGNRWARQASHLAVICAWQTFARNGKPNRHHTYDAGAAMLAASLQAWSRGIAVHQMAGFQAEQLQQALQIPQEVTVIAVAALGYETDDTSALSEELRAKELGPRSRLPLEQILAVGGLWPFVREGG